MGHKRVRSTVYQSDHKLTTRRKSTQTSDNYPVESNRSLIMVLSTAIMIFLILIFVLYEKFAQ